MSLFCVGVHYLLVSDDKKGFFLCVLGSGKDEVHGCFACFCLGVQYF